MTLPALRAPLPVLVDEVLALTDGLHPDAALARIAPLWDAVPDGLARRALLAARIALMRRAMGAAPEVVEAVAAPMPETVVAPEPVFVPAPPPKPAPVTRAALTTLLSLEDAAKMLLAGGDDAEEATPALAQSPSPSPAPSPERAEAEAELAEVIAREAAEVHKAKGRKGRAKPIIPDLDHAFAAMDGADAPAPKPAMPDLSAAFAAMEDEAPAEPPKAKVIDFSAAFAAMNAEADTSEGEAAPEPAGDVPEALGEVAAKPAASDLGAAFAGMEEAVPPAAAPKPKKAGKAAAAGIDLSAQFAAMQGD